MLIGIMLGVVVLVIVKLDVMMLSAIVLRRTSQLARLLGKKCSQGDARGDKCGVTSFRWRHDIHHNDIQHNDTQHQGFVCDTHHNNALHYAECHIDLLLC